MNFQFVRNLWIINRSGLCLIQRNYTGNDVNELEFAGLMTLIIHITRETGLGDPESEIECIKTKSVQLYYQHVPSTECLVVMAVDKKTKYEILKNTFVMVISRFVDFYRENINLLQKRVVRKGIFRQIEEEIDEIIKIKGQSFAEAYNQQCSVLQETIEKVMNGEVKDISSSVDEIMALFKALPAHSQKLINSSFKDIEKMLYQSKNISKEQSKRLQPLITGLNLAINFYL